MFLEKNCSTKKKTQTKKKLTTGYDKKVTPLQCSVLIYPSLSRKVFISYLGLSSETNKPKQTFIPK